jgi:DNA-binding response OmpR family regulator
VAGLQKILLVEDNVELSHIYETFLTQHGFEVVTAFDGEEALAKAPACLPQLVFLDIMMPKKDGFQVLKALRNEEQYGCTHARIVMLTNIGDATKLDPGMQDDIDGYVVKAEIVLQDLLDIIGSFDVPPSAQQSAAPALHI